jgi:hypothetical protein
VSVSLPNSLGLTRARCSESAALSTAQAGQTVAAVPRFQGGSRQNKGPAADGARFPPFSLFKCER